MSLYLRLATAVAVAFLMSGTAALAAGEHSHQGPGSAGLAAMTLNGKAKWQTDAPLRKGMEGIRHNLEAALPKIHHDKLDAEGYRNLAVKVQLHIDDMVANCKLPPEVDAQAHLVLEQLIEGSQQMEAGPARSDGAVKIVQALDAYGRHFEHPRWKAPKH